MASVIFIEKLYVFAKSTDPRNIARRSLMTLKQLRYVVTVADTGNITEAAAKLFIAQPSLTAAIREIENEYKVTIFDRSNKGVEVTAEGEEFLGYARQILEQADLIEERYTGKTEGKTRFCVSAQHYSFAVEAFVELLKLYGGNKYEFHMRETQTYDIIDDVAKLPDISGPALFDQKVDGFGRKFFGGFAALSADTFCKVVYQYRDVAFALVQRRDFYNDYAKAVIQVFAETPFGNLFAEVFIGSGNDPHVDGNIFVSSHRGYFTLLKGAEHFCLCRERHVSDLVEEDGAVVGLLEFAFVVFDGRGE